MHAQVISEMASEAPGALPEELGLAKAMLESMNSIWAVVKQPIVRVSAADRFSLENNRLLCLGLFLELGKFHKARNLPLYKVTTKLHRVDHILRFAVDTGMSPNTTCCLKFEDAAGKVAKV